jgi:hypothetical protein
MKAPGRRTFADREAPRPGFPPLEARRAPVPALAEGDLVRWVEWDGDIPKGHVGEVLAGGSGL